MSDSADVKSTDVIRAFAAAVVKFQEEARLCLVTLDSQLRQLGHWLEQDRPGFWKNEIERCIREVSEARVRLHQCRMRRMGDFRPSCIPESKAHDEAKRALEFAQSQVPVVRHWLQEVTHEASEFRGRAGRLHQCVERDLPQLLAMLKFSLEQLEEYGQLAAPAASRMSQLTASTAASETAPATGESGPAAAAVDGSPAGSTSASAAAENTENPGSSEGSSSTDTAEFTGPADS